MMSDESTIYRTKLHWIVLVDHVAYLVPCTLIFGLWMVLADPTGLLIGGMLFLIPSVNAFSSFLNYSKSEFLITNKRIIVKTGSLRKVSKDFGLSKIESIELDQGILGRSLGYGSITLNGTGGTLSRLLKISNPLEFKKELQEQIANLQSR